MWWSLFPVNQLNTLIYLSPNADAIKPRSHSLKFCPLARATFLAFS